MIEMWTMLGVALAGTAALVWGVARVARTARPAEAILLDEATVAAHRRAA